MPLYPLEGGFGSSSFQQVSRLFEELGVFDANPPVIFPGWEVCRESLNDVF